MKPRYHVSTDELVRLLSWEVSASQSLMELAKYLGRCPDHEKPEDTCPRCAPIVRIAVAHDEIHKGLVELLRARKAVADEVEVK